MYLFACVRNTTIQPPGHWNPAARQTVRLQYSTSTLQVLSVSSSRPRLSLAPARVVNPIVRVNFALSVTTGRQRPVMD